MPVNRPTDDVGLRLLQGGRTSSDDRRGAAPADFRGGFKAVVADAMVRQAEAELALHQNHGRRLRAFFVERKIERLVGHPPRKAQVGNRIATYIRLGARETR